MIDNPFVSVSSRELEIIHLIAGEQTSQEIAQQLHISIHTVESHRRRIFEKMKVRNAAGVVRKSFEVGILAVG